ncbi:zinc finger protein 664 [Drosophila obscura]|uniref:zinc finger protein 664 n=1 Tax=Drosophila obscura TaxID=7282 RepID=UPI001BB11AB5|nr:zinc finger protein 664 [Drosophila obscura]
MLKHCLVHVDYTRLHAQQKMQPKCGEIFYEQECNSFHLACCLCDMKHFSFDDFVRHIRNIHFDKQGKPQTQAVTVRAPVQPNSAEEKFLTAVKCDDVHEPEDPFTLRISDHKDVQSKGNLETEGLWECAENTSNSESDGCDLEPETILGSPCDRTDEENEDEAQQSIFKRPPKEFCCKHCDRKYTSLKYLNIHIKMYHPHPKAFKCSDCGDAFDVVRALEAHRRKLHTDFNCKLCAKIFKNSRTLLRHVQGHSGVRQYKCDFENCEKSFTNKHNLNSHRRIHRTERNYVCELCGYRSRYREALIVHRRSHTGEKPFKCETCARCFASKSLLNEHQPMHSTERPYKCNDCEATFSRPKALYHHKHLHLGIKKFKCKVCGNAYAQAAGLSAHMRGHKQQAANGVSEGNEMEMLFTC